MTQEIFNRIERLKGEIKKLEHEQYMLEMKDGWDAADLFQAQSLSDQIRSKKLEIEALQEDL